MAVRFLSFSYNKHNIIGNSLSNNNNNNNSNNGNSNTYGKSNNAGWYSTLYPKSKVNKLL